MNYAIMHFVMVKMKEYANCQNHLVIEERNREKIFMNLLMNWVVIKWT